MKNALTASERRGILAVAGLSLLLTGSGWVVSMCQRPASDEALPEMEVLAAGGLDTVTGSGGASLQKRGHRNKKDSAGKKANKKAKQYRRRSPLDEPAQ